MARTSFEGNSLLQLLCLRFAWTPMGNLHSRNLTTHWSNTTLKYHGHRSFQSTTLRFGFLFFLQNSRGKSLGNYKRRRKRSGFLSRWSREARLRTEVADFPVSCWTPWQTLTMRKEQSATRQDKTPERGTRGRMSGARSVCASTAN